MVNTTTIVDIVQREKKTSTVCTEKKMDTSLKNVASKRGMGTNERTDT